MTGAGLDPAAFALRQGQLDEMRAALTGKVLEGFAAEGQEIKALPAWIGPPPRSLQGRALVVDVGGTNLRAAVVSLAAGEVEVVSGPVSSRLEVRDAHGTAASFFGQHAALVKKLDPEPGLPLGYCFSYPSLVEPDGDAVLLNWTKGIDVDGVVGHKVGAALQRALAEAGVSTRSVFVLNDTVAALLAGATMAENPARTIGLIVGTGTNMAAFFDAGRLTKLDHAGSGPLAVNLESGAFVPPHLTEIDDELASRTEPLGGQRMEKAVSGHYLPLLLDAACPGLPGFDPSGASRAVVEVAAGSGPGADVARAILQRSADLVAAGLAGVADLLPGEGAVTVLAEGGLYWKAPGYDARVRSTLAAFAQGFDVITCRREEANLLGAAAAALVRAAS